MPVEKNKESFQVGDWVRCIAQSIHPTIIKRHSLYQVCETLSYIDGQYIVLKGAENYGSFSSDIFEFAG